MLNIDKTTSNLNAGKKAKIKLINKTKKAFITGALLLGYVTSLTIPATAAYKQGSEIGDITGDGITEYNVNLENDNLIEDYINSENDLYEETTNLIYERKIGDISVQYRLTKDRDFLQEKYQDYLERNNILTEKKHISDYDLSEEDFNKFIDIVLNEKLLNAFPTFFENGVENIIISDIDPNLILMAGGTYYSAASNISIPIFSLTKENAITGDKAIGDEYEIYSFSNDLKWDVEIYEKYGFSGGSFQTFYHELGHAFDFYYENIIKGYEQLDYKNKLENYINWAEISQTLDEKNYFSNSEREFKAEIYKVILSMAAGMQFTYNRGLSFDINCFEASDYYVRETKQWIKTVDEFIETGDTTVLKRKKMQPYELSSEFLSKVVTPELKEKIEENSTNDFILIKILKDHLRNSYDNIDKLSEIKIKAAYIKDGNVKFKTVDIFDDDYWYYKDTGTLLSYYDSKGKEKPISNGNYNEKNTIISDYLNDFVEEYYSSCMTKEFHSNVLRKVNETKFLSKEQDKLDKVFSRFELEREIQKAILLRNDKKLYFMVENYELFFSSENSDFIGDYNKAEYYVNTKKYLEIYDRLASSNSSEDDQDLNFKVVVCKKTSDKGYNIIEMGILDYFKELSIEEELIQTFLLGPAVEFKNGITDYKGTEWISGEEIFQLNYNLDITEEQKKILEQKYDAEYEKIINIIKLGIEESKGYGERGVFRAR